jgi:hypothetical protein
MRARLILGFVTLAGLWGNSAAQTPPGNQHHPDSSTDFWASRVAVQQA